LVKLCHIIRSGPVFLRHSVLVCSAQGDSHVKKRQTQPCEEYHRRLQSFKLSVLLICYTWMD